MIPILFKVFLFFKGLFNGIPILFKALSMRFKIIIFNEVPILFRAF